MKTFEERYTAWIDGRLAGGDLAAFEKELAARGGSPAEREGAERTGQLLRVFATAPRLENGDFFNHQILHRIEQENREPARAAGWRWTLPRLAWAGALCLLLAAGMFQLVIPAARDSHDASYYAEVLHTRPGDDLIRARTVWTPEDNVTVIWLDGLDDLPADYVLE